MSWVLFTLLSALFWSVTNIIDKYVIDKYFQDPMIGTIVNGLIGFISGIITIIFVGFVIPSTNLLLISIFVGLTYASANYFFFKSILNEEVSRVISIWSIYPIFVLVLAVIFLGEMFSPMKYFGIFLIVVGSFSISIKRDVKLKLSKVIFLMTLSSMLYAFSDVALKYILGDLGFWHTFFWTRLTQFIVILFFFIFIVRHSLK